AERHHQARSQHIRGWLARHQEHVELRALEHSRRRVHDAPPGFGPGTPMTNRPARSAACVTRSGSAMIVSPATTAIPASPARVAASIVLGPIVGRSTRRSWPGFAAFTRTPVRVGARILPMLRNSAIL